MPDPADSLAEGPVGTQMWASVSVGVHGCSQHVPQASGLSSVRSCLVPVLCLAQLRPGWPWPQGRDVRQTPGWRQRCPDNKWQQ